MARKHAETIAQEVRAQYALLFYIYRSLLQARSVATVMQAKEAALVSYAPYCISIYSLLIAD